MDHAKNSSPTSNIVNLASYRNKKAESEKIAHQGTVSTASDKSSKDFNVRLSRIRASLDRIGLLMQELKKMSKDKNRPEN